jgi:hypothetical protein
MKKNSCLTKTNKLYMWELISLVIVGVILDVTGLRRPIEKWYFKRYYPYYFC